VLSSAATKTPRGGAGPVRASLRHVQIVRDEGPTVPARAEGIPHALQLGWHGITFPSNANLPGSAAQFNGSVSRSPPPHRPNKTTLARGGLRDTLLEVRRLDFYLQESTGMRAAT